MPLFVVTLFVLAICSWGLLCAMTSLTVVLLLQVVGAMEYLGPDASVKVGKQAVLRASASAAAACGSTCHHQTPLQQLSVSTK
jgi:hypothetical protein